MEIVDIPLIVDKSMKEYKRIRTENTSPVLREEYLNSENDLNLLYHCDNIYAIMNLIEKGYEKRIDLIYVDPPFFSESDYKKRIELKANGEKHSIEYLAYRDTWDGGFNQYLEMLTLRIMLMKDLLSDEGSIYVHVDYRAVHYIKVIMDHIFGMDNFLNEIIWAYKSGGSSTKHFSRKHDNILVYSNTKKYIFNPQKEKSYNRGYKPYRFKGVEEFEDDIGWYTLVNMKDVWQIDMVGRTSKERVGYETQKPEALLERIILSSSREGSVVADFFAGSGTTLITAEKNNRRWVGSDMENLSIITIKKRMNFIDSKLSVLEMIKDEDDKGSILFDNISYNESNSEDINISFKISGYKMDLSKIKIGRKYKDKVIYILENNSLSLIEYMAVITDNKIAYEVFRDGKDYNIENEVNLILKKEHIDEIFIKIVDIFGTSILKKLVNNKKIL